MQRVVVALLLAACGCDRSARDHRIDELEAKVAAMTPRDAATPLDAAVAVQDPPDMHAPAVQRAHIPPMACHAPVCFQTVDGKQACWCSSGAMRYCVVLPERWPCLKSDFPPKRKK